MYTFYFMRYLMDYCMGYFIEKEKEEKKTRRAVFFFTQDSML